MTTTTTMKTTKKRTGKRQSFLPPSADVVKISGREYIIAPLDEFKEWDEDRTLAALMEERIKEGGPYISLEEFERHLDQRNKGRKK